MTLVNEDKLVVDPIIVKGDHGEVNVLSVANIHSGILEHVHTQEIIHIEVGNVGIID